MPQCPRLIVALMLAVVLPCMAHAAGPVPKPHSPLTLTITPALEPVAGRNVEFRVALQSQVDVASIQITVNLPAGSVLNHGQLVWQGSLKRGDVQLLVFDAMLPIGSDQSVVAVATAGEQGRSQLSARAQYRTEPPAAVTAVTAEKPRVVTRNGQRVDEYVLQ